LLLCWFDSSANLLVGLPSKGNHGPMLDGRDRSGRWTFDRTAEGFSHFLARLGAFGLQVERSGERPVAASTPARLSRQWLEDRFTLPPEWELEDGEVVTVSVPGTGDSLVTGAALPRAGSST
jgi:hypothetical protein